jgi:hypothetical protein
MMMKDSEIGDLWHDVNVPYGFWAKLPGAKKAIIELIRKLVSERASRYFSRKLGIEVALREFGIDKKDWHV